MNYGYMGASWGALADLNRSAAKNAQQQWATYAPQRSAMNVRRRQMDVQRGVNAMQQKDRTMQFGLNALAGLAR